MQLDFNFDKRDLSNEKEVFLILLAILLMNYQII